MLNVEDTHVVTYALKKLVKAGYVTSEKAGKSFFSTTEEGKALCMKYREVREACLISIHAESGIPGASIGETAQLPARSPCMIPPHARRLALRTAEQGDTPPGQLVIDRFSDDFPVVASSDVESSSTQPLRQTAGSGMAPYLQTG